MGETPGSARYVHWRPRPARPPSSSMIAGTRTSPIPTHQTHSKHLPTIPPSLKNSPTSYRSPLLFRSVGEPAAKILVTKTYDEMFCRSVRRVRGTREEQAARQWCVSMTRSPLRATTHRCTRSPGKTTFLNFMLARLLSLHQVVFPCDNLIVYLFYCGKMYTLLAIPLQKDDSIVPCEDRLM